MRSVVAIALVLAGCAASGTPRLAPAVVAEAQVTTTPYAIEDLFPHQYLEGDGDELWLAADFHASIGGVPGDVASATATTIQLGLATGLAAGSYPLVVSAKGATWTIDDALTVEPGAIARPACDATDPTLVACWAFDGDLVDRSSHHLDLAGDGATYATGALGQAVIPGEALTLPYTAVLDRPTLTIEAWIDPSVLPDEGESRAIVDRQKAYGFALGHATLTCLALTAPASIATGVWTHVACVNDGATTRLYVGGALVGEVADTSLVTSLFGLEVGGDSPSGTNVWRGGLDEVSLYGAARTSTAICRDAGGTTCP